MRDVHPLAHMTTAELVEKRVQQFCAPRGRKSVWAGNRKMEVRTPGERVLYLPNGTKVRVSVDDSGCATQVEEDHNLHAIARPKSIRVDPRRLK